MPVLTRPDAEVDVFIAEEQMLVRRRHVDVAALEPLLVEGDASRERTRAREDRVEHARPCREKVKDDEDRCRQLRRQACNQALQRLDAAGGCSHHDHVAV
jgi:hypothetical protein